MTIQKDNWGGVYEAVLAHGTPSQQERFSGKYLLKRTDTIPEVFFKGVELQLYRKLAQWKSTRNAHQLLFPAGYQVREELGSERIDFIVRKVSRGDLASISEMTTQEGALAHVGALSKVDTLSVLRDIGIAFDLLHSSEISYLHRDLKPWNILGDDEGFCLTDFGISLPYSPPFAYDRETYCDFVIWLLSRLRPLDIPDRRELNAAIARVYGSRILRILERFQQDESLSFGEFGGLLSEVICSV